MTNKRRLGVHTSIAGGIYLSMERARQLGCTTMQIFSHNPRQWHVGSIPRQDLLEFKNLRASYDINPVYVHSSYLINLAAQNTEILDKSLQLLIQEMNLADLLEADYVVLHTGSASRDIAANARSRAIAVLKTIEGQGKWNCKLLLENTAGEKGDITSSIGDLAEIVNSLGSNLIGGICIDTCHAFAAGYNLATKAGLSEIVFETNKHIGLSMVKLIHLNDSKKSYNSRVDRHEHIGDGHIGETNLNNLVNHVAFKSVPLILETPKKNEEDDPRNLAVVRNFMR